MSFDMTKHVYFNLSSYWNKIDKVDR